MIDFIEGELVSRSPGQVTVALQGVGFLVLIPLSTYDKLPTSGSVRLHTHLVPREDAFHLFGFLTQREREIFLLLTTVKGVGPRLALKILSGLEPEEFLRAVIEEDAGTLCKISGVGRKTAQRLVLEMKDAVKHLALPERPLVERAEADAVVALTKLGATRNEAEKAVASALKTLPPGSTTEDIVRECLRKGFV